MPDLSVRAERAGHAALAALRGGPATVFAAFERSCYVETRAGIACLGAGIGAGPLNVIVERFGAPAVGDRLSVDLLHALTWTPSLPSAPRAVPEQEVPESILGPARAFLGWIAGKGQPDDSLIGLGPGLTPAGDDFVGGAMIALRAFGQAERAERIAAWALPLAETNTGRISRAHLACAAAGEGHEALHALLAALGTNENAIEAAWAALDRVGHSSGRDAAAGALLALRALSG
jgi:hypothetical protein